MIVDLQRESSTDEGTFGRVAVDGVFCCYSLEPGRDALQHPAIPAGAYSVTITESVRFKRRLPLIIGVPGRRGIRVHPGNTEDDTEGCLLLGTALRDDTLVNSRAACETFQHRIAQPLAAGETVTVRVHDVPETT